jgi:putative transposase
VFIAIDHCSAECVGIHAARRATRFEALEPIRQGVRRCFGAFGKRNSLTRRTGG